MIDESFSKLVHSVQHLMFHNITEDIFS